MVLKCPECGGMVSSTLSNCPHCGFAMAQASTLSCDDLYNLAFKAQEEGRNEDAINYIDKLLEIDPMHYQAWLFKGNTISWQIADMVSKDARNAACEAWGNALKYAPSDKDVKDVTGIISKDLKLSFEGAQKHYFSILETGHYSTQDFAVNLFCLTNYIEFHSEASKRMDEQYRRLTGEKTSPFSKGINEKCDMSLWSGMVYRLSDTANADALKASGLSQMPQSYAAAGLFLRSLEDSVDKLLAKENWEQAYRTLSQKVDSFQTRLQMAGFNGRAFDDDVRRMRQKADRISETINREKAEAEKRKKEAEERERQKREAQRKASYWSEHIDEKNAIWSSIEEKRSHVSQLKSQITQLQEVATLQELESSYSELVEKQKRLGIFKAKEKRESIKQLEVLEEKIDKAKCEVALKKNEIITEINSTKNEISKLQGKLSNPFISANELSAITASDLMVLEETPVPTAAQKKKQRQNSKKAKWIAAVVCLISLVGIGLLAYNYVIIPTKQYNEAVEQLEQSNYQQAIDGFEALGDYKDSADMVLQTKYTWAESLLAEKAYDEAYAKFKEIQDYSDAAERMEDVRYTEAEEYLNSNGYGKAIELFERLGGYKDSRTRVLEASYLWAEDYLKQGQLEDALLYFERAGLYKDAKARADEVYEMMQIHATAVKLNKTSLTISKGKTAELTATLEPADTTDKIVGWRSSDTNVATVDKNGVVTAAGYGTATIDVQTSNGLIATCKVTVPDSTINSTSNSKAETQKPTKKSVNAKFNGTWIAYSCNSNWVTDGGGGVLYYNIDTTSKTITVVNTNDGGKHNNSDGYYEKFSFKGTGDKISCDWSTGTFRNALTNSYTLTLASDDLIHLAESQLMGTYTSYYVLIRA